MSADQGFSFTFTAAGNFPYSCAIHPSMQGTIVASQGQASARPTLTSPPSSTVLANFNPTLTWDLPAGSTQYHLKVIPANNDGAGVNITGNAAAASGSTSEPSMSDYQYGFESTSASSTNSFTIPAPPQWYGLLPDMGYTWMVRATSSPLSLGENDLGWSDWSQTFSFRTPVVSSAIIGAVSPTNGATVDSPTPTVQWSNSNPNIFYYEVQISKDPSFGPNAFLYSELRHGGVTSPPNSYTVPSQFPLELNTRYYWHVRPRIQGDGTVLPWSTSWEFVTVTPGPRRGATK
ncbi:MAG: hypothetical protein EXR50_05900 [Dehalococcoidia bacterium]|nr:hypothetical protein [Dehalococcoidia bacterium]